jgi:hypothetical protein
LGDKWVALASAEDNLMPTPSLIRRRPPTARSGRKEALRDEGGILAKKNRAPAGDGNLATVAAFYRLAIQFDEVVSNLALMGSSKADGMAAVFKPEEPSPPLTPEREAARQVLNDEEREILEAMERDLGRPLTEEEEHLALEPGALIEQPRRPRA